VSREQAINEALARALFGWQTRIHPQACEGWQGTYWVDPNGYARNSIPAYCTTWSGMGEVVEAMRERKWMYDIHASEIGQHKASFESDCNAPSVQFAFEWADTAPLAVALAALRALGVAVPGEGESDG
jgi:hypothetical protein